MPVKKENPFLRPQAGEKRQVGLTVLHAKFPRRVVFIKQRFPACDAIFLQQRGGNRLNILLLEDAEILSQPGAPQGRVDGQAVAHLPAVVLFHPEAGDNAADTALRRIALPDSQGGVLFQYVFRCLPERIAGDVHLQRKREGITLFQQKAHHGEGFWLQAIHFQREM
ncbi:hypothetical protein CIFRMM091B2_16310 [Citrobacter freundii]